MFIVVFMLVQYEEGTIEHQFTEPGTAAHPPPSPPPQAVRLACGGVW